MEHTKAFVDVPAVEFRNCKSLKDYLVRAPLTKINDTEVWAMWQDNLFSGHLFNNYDNFYSRTLGGTFQNLKWSFKTGLGKRTVPFGM